MGSHFYVCLVAWHGRQCGDFGDGKINIFAPTGTALAISVGPLAVTNGGTLTIPGLWYMGTVMSRLARARLVLKEHWLLQTKREPHAVP